MRRSRGSQMKRVACSRTPPSIALVAFATTLARREDRRARADPLRRGERQVRILERLARRSVVAVASGVGAELTAEEAVRHRARAGHADSAGIREHLLAGLAETNSVLQQAHAEA